MVNRNKEKGDRLEAKLVEMLLLAGFHARRTPKSGSGPLSSNPGSGYDISLSLFDKVYKVEAKARGVAFQTFYKWLRKSDMVIVKQNFEEPLVVLPLRLAIELMNATKKQQKTDYDMRTSQAKVGELMRKINRDLITPNEARRQVGLPPIPSWEGKTCPKCKQKITNSSCACGVYGVSGHQCDPGSKGK